MSRIESLKFEVEHALRQVVQKEGDAISLVHSSTGQRLMANLAAIEALKATKKAA